MLSAFTRQLIRAIRFTRQYPHWRRRRRRTPLRSTKRDAKRAAHRYAKELAGRDLSWKSARKLLARLDREGRSQAVAASAPAGTSR